MGSGDIAWRVFALFTAKMVFSPQRRAYFRMSHLMVMMSQYKRIFVFPVTKIDFRKMASASAVISLIRSY